MGETNSWVDKVTE